MSAPTVKQERGELQALVELLGATPSPEFPHTERLYGMTTSFYFDYGDLIADPVLRVRDGLFFSEPNPGSEVTRKDTSLTLAISGPQKFKWQLTMVSEKRNVGIYEIDVDRDSPTAVLHDVDYQGRYQGTREVSGRELEDAATFIEELIVGTDMLEIGKDLRLKRDAMEEDIASLLSNPDGLHSNQLAKKRQEQVNNLRKIKLSAGTWFEPPVNHNRGLTAEEQEAAVQRTAEAARYAREIAAQRAASKMLRPLKLFIVA